MKNTSDIIAESDTKDKKLTNESLLLPCVSGNKSTSASLAERSNVWAENKLCERKVTLDKKLHKSIVRLNVDILEVADELSKLNRMKKSASTGALDKLHTHAHNSHHLPRDHHHLETKFKSSAPVSPIIVIRKKKAQHSHELHSNSTSNQANGHKTVDKKNGCLLKPSENKSGIGIKIGSGSSSDELSDDEKQGVKANTKTFSASACQSGRQCSTRRSEQQTFENTTRRFKHLKAGSPSKHVK